jgi:putative hydrolase of the HAD superfamily
MNTNSLKSYFTGLKPLKPEVSEIKASLKPLTGIKAVIFDVYGTLCISAKAEWRAGELDRQARQILQRSGFKIHTEFRTASLYDFIDRQVRQEVVREQARKKARGIIYPEVDIISIWKEAMRSLHETDIIAGFTKPDWPQLALGFEFLRLRAWPFPDLAEALAALGRKGMQLGIISNAQFYTLPLLRYFLKEKDFLGSQALPNFNRDLCFFSFQEGEAKPSMLLFQKCRSQLTKLEITGKQTLYIGNDMEQDLVPARKAGFKVALFAGDQRSLRPGFRIQNLEHLKPDVIFTNLSQLDQVLVVPAKKKVKVKPVP